MQKKTKIETFLNRRTCKSEEITKTIYIYFKMLKLFKQEVDNNLSVCAFSLMVV